jgi:hypothetical protein
VVGSGVNEVSGCLGWIEELVEMVALLAYAVFRPGQGPRTSFGPGMAISLSFPLRSGRPVCLPGATY